MKKPDFLNIFIDESRDLLAQMEAILLHAERECMSADQLPSEELHALFRCAHTIKGSAGMFGLDALVKFTHEVEGVLDGVRKNTLALSSALTGLLLDCQQFMADTINAVPENAAHDQSRDDALIARLHQYLAQPPDAAKPMLVATPPGCAVTTEKPVNNLSSCWHLSLRFDASVLRYGNDPLGMISYLRTLGKLHSVNTIVDLLPDLKNADAESCYLGFEIDFQGECDKAAIEDVFAFVADISSIRITQGEAALNDLPVTIDSEQFSGMPSLALSASGAEPAEVVSQIATQKQATESRRLEIKAVKVPSERLDALIDQVGEMVIAGAAAQLKALKTHDQDVIEALSNLLRLVEEVRDTALCLRMTPIGDVFNRFTRVVRDLSRELGKNIDLIIEGADTELDKSMVEKIADPLMHLVRNALDHGIESPAKRKAAGKSERGTLLLNAHHESGSIIIEVKDDGAGLDVARIRQKAIERGLVSAHANLSDQQVWRLILEPGFSTAETITNVSGRGVGMDVVKTAIESLRGSIDICSVPGQGTTMRVTVPLTLAIIDGFQVGVGSNTFILPLDSIETCIELTNGMESRGCLNLRGNIIPVIRLPELFSLKASADSRNNVVVVRFAGRQAAIAVDRLQGECQAVIKPLGPLFEDLKGIAGSTILGSGDVALVLDVPQLVQLAAGESARMIETNMIEAKMIEASMINATMIDTKLNSATARLH